MAGALALPQIAQADGDDTAPGRLLGTNQAGSDGFDTALEGPPGALGTGRYTDKAHNNSGKSAGIIQGDNFSVNLTNPQTHGHSEDVGAKAGWNWEF